jgi:hypothetical protein
MEAQTEKQLDSLIDSLGQNKYFWIPLKSYSE